MINNNSTHPGKFNMLNEDQKFINEILERNGLEIKWLSDKLRLEYEIVRYQLREAQNYRQDFHARAIEILKKEGYVSSNKELCDKLKDDIIDFSTVLTTTVAVISRNIKDKISDRYLDAEEKKQIKEQLRLQQMRVNDCINDLFLTIEMK
jgi:hypothetical protein